RSYLVRFSRTLWLCLPRDYPNRQRTYSEHNDQRKNDEPFPAPLNFGFSHRPASFLQLTIRESQFREFRHHIFMLEPGARLGLHPDSYLAPAPLARSVMFIAMPPQAP